ncbi:MAG: hypothetical protein R2748_25640 [Bryobacterales bacterium]
MSDTPLSAIQRRGLLALLTHPTIRKAAQSIGVHERTVRRWLENPNFRSALDAMLHAHEQQRLNERRPRTAPLVDALQNLSASQRAAACARLLRHL